MTKKKKITIISTVTAVAVISLGAAALWQGLTVRNYTQVSDKIENPIRIAVIADLHNVFYGDNQEKLIAKINNQLPDLIMLAGDIAPDANNNDGAEALFNAIGNKYPCYYVAGNHEFWSGRPRTIKEMVRSYGITVLEGSVTDVEVNGQTIQVGGVDDPDRFDTTMLSYGEDCVEWNDELNYCSSQLDADKYSILLSHRPELVNNYAGSGFDLVLSGHAHGGQVRIPFILNGLYAPNQGVFPEHAGGLYKLSDQTDLIVSRGISRFIYPPRVFNPPELVIVDIVPQ